jgi:hypothetical protein
MSWLDELSNRPISWQLFVVILAGAGAVVLLWGRWEWGRRLGKWAREQGYELTDFRGATREERRSVESSFADRDSDWLEVLMVTVRHTNGKERRALISFKSWLGVGPYRVRDIQWME